MNGADYDVIIVGGGPVGTSLARALSCLPLRLALVEARPLDLRGPVESGRVIALAYGSRRFFEALGAWPGLARHAEPIRRIHVSNRGYPGFTRLSAGELETEALGYVCEEHWINQTLQQNLPIQPNLDLYTPAAPARIKLSPEWAEITLQRGTRLEPLRARLLVAADGGASSVGQLLDIPFQYRNYHQAAITAWIKTASPHLGTAYERFTRHGPLAMLPLDPGHSALIWTVPEDHAEAFRLAREREFLETLQTIFGWRLGRLLAVGPRRAYPLRMRQCAAPVRQRLVFIGNAAHTLHPVAGQGLNLGLRDVASLAELLADAGDPGDPGLLREYAAWRRADQRVTGGFTDGLVRLFSNELPPLALARNLGMLALDRLPPLKRLLLRQAAGMAGRQPRLMRGLGLGQG